MAANRVAAVLSAACRRWPAARTILSPFVDVAGSRTLASHVEAPRFTKPDPAKAVIGKLPSGPTPGSFMAQGVSKLVDTLYFRRLGAIKGGKVVSGAFTPDSFSGQVVLYVNTASLCGFTPQLRQLQVGRRVHTGGRGEGRV